MGRMHECRKSRSAAHALGPTKLSASGTCRRRRLKLQGPAADGYNLNFRLQRTSVRQSYGRGVSGVGTMRNRTPASLVFALGLVVGLAGPLALLAFR